MKRILLIFAICMIFNMSFAYLTAMALSTSAGTVIQNQATVQYKDDNQNPMTPVSSDPNTASTVVSQVYGVDVSPPTGAETALAGTIAHYPSTITNTGNGNDTFNLTATSSNGYTTIIYHDINGNGVLDAEDIAAGPITSTTQLPQNGTYNVIAVVNIPAGAADASTDVTTLTATSQGNGSKTDTGTYTTTVAKAVLLLSKTQDVSNPNPGDTITYTITYKNSGSATAINAVVISDPIPSDVTYVAGSITFNGSPRTDGTGDDNCEFSANTVKANVGNVSASGTGTITFKVKVNAGVPQYTQIVNTATANFKDANNNPQTPVIATSPPAIVAQTAGVDIYNSQSTAATPGDQIVYGFSIKNTGNGSDTFNGEISSTAGIVWAFYVDANGDGIINNGDALATDSDADGRPDTGILAPNEVRKYLAIGTVPVGTADGTVDVTTLTAISKADPSVTDSITLTTTIQAPSVTVTKTVSPTGDQPPGTELTYTIVVTNTGTGNATNVFVTDSVPTTLTYLTNSVTLNGSPRTDNVDGDQVQVVGGVVTVNIGILGPSGSVTITFKATIK